MRTLARWKSTRFPAGARKPSAGAKLPAETHRLPAAALKLSAVPVVVVLTALTVAGCDLLSADRDYLVSLPELPAHWADITGDLGITAEVVLSDGASWTAELGPGERRTVVRVPKGSGATVLLWPTYRGYRLPPAGTAVPWLARGSRAAATWHDGVTATILRRLALGEVGFSTLNVPRLSRELRLRVPENPWSVDIDRVVEKLAGGSFRATYIRERAAEPVGVELPGGAWINTSPFDPTVSTMPSAVPPQGVRYLDAGRRLILDVAFEAPGKPIVALLPLR